MSITKLSPNWACQMGPIHCPKFLLSGKVCLPLVTSSLILWTNCRSFFYPVVLTKIIESYVVLIDISVTLIGLDNSRPTMNGKHERNNLGISCPQNSSVENYQDLCPKCTISRYSILKVQHNITNRIMKISQS